MSDDGLTMLEGLAREGLTDELICKKIGIGVRTFYEWMERFPQIAQAIKKGKAPVDVQVENALLKRALGYTEEETTTEIIEQPDGRKRKQIRKVLRVFPPDTTAQIFWLKNRKPEKWRDRIEQVQQVENELLQSLLELERGSRRD